MSKWVVIRLWHDDRAQDMVEYALLAAFVAVAASAVLPEYVTSINVIFSRIRSLTSKVAAF